MKIYFAAPLFCKMELDRNLAETAVLERAGHEVYLPQRDGGEVIKGKAPKEVFDCDVGHLEEADVVIAYADGRVPDEGMCFEMGYAFARNTPIIVVSSDSRSFENGIPNAMLLCSGPWVKSTEEALKLLERKYRAN